MKVNREKKFKIYLLPYVCVNQSYMDNIKRKLCSMIATAKLELFSSAKNLYKDRRVSEEKRVN